MTLDDRIGSGEDEECNTLKIQILDHYVARNGPDYYFFHNLANGQLLTQDKQTIILGSLDGVIGNYNITSGYLTKEEATKHMRGDL